MFFFCLSSLLDNELYSGTVADFSGSDPIIYRETLQTEQYDSLSLNGKICAIESNTARGVFEVGALVNNLCRRVSRKWTRPLSTMKFSRPHHVQTDAVIYVCLLRFGGDRFSWENWCCLHRLPYRFLLLLLLYHFSRENARVCNNNLIGLSMWNSRHARCLCSPLVRKFLLLFHYFVGGVRLSRVHAVFSVTFICVAGISFY